MASFFEDEVTRRMTVVGGLRLCNFRVGVGLSGLVPGLSIAGQRTRVAQRGRAVANCNNPARPNRLGAPGGLPSTM